MNVQAANPAATTAPTQAPVAPAAPAKSGRDAAIEQVARARTEGDTPAPTAAPSTKPKEEPSVSRELAAAARENRKILMKQDELKKLGADLEAQKLELQKRKADLEIMDKLRAGELEALEALDPKWYDSATRRMISKMKPGSPEAIKIAFDKELERVNRELEALKKPKEEPPPKVDANVVREKLEAYRSEVATRVITSDEFVALKNEDANEVAKEVETYVDRALRAAEARAEKLGKRFVATQNDVDLLTTRALKQLEAAVLAQKKDLTTNSGGETTSAATARTSSESGTAQPQQIKTRPKTITGSLTDAVPVSAGPRTPEERRQAAIELLRRTREAEQA